MILICWRLLITDLFWWVGDFLSQTCLDELATFYRRPVLMSWRLLIADLFGWLGDFLLQTYLDELATSYRRPVLMCWWLLIADLFLCLNSWQEQSWSSGQAERQESCGRLLQLHCFPCRWRKLTSWRFKWLCVAQWMPLLLFFILTTCCYMTLTNCCYVTLTNGCYVTLTNCCYIIPTELLYNPDQLLLCKRGERM